MPSIAQSPRQSATTLSTKKTISIRLQLSLLADKAIKQSESLEWRLSIESVPQDVRLGDKTRFWIVVQQFDLRWHYPIQFRQDEIQLFLPHLQRLNWELDESEGYPIEAPFIHTQIEYLIDSWLPIQQQQQQRRVAA